MERRNRGITLIALVITIIVLLILAGITLNLVIGENGIMKKAQESGVVYSEKEAREKLELVLLDMQADKVTNSKYNQDDYLTSKIQENGMIVEDDIVYVDGWKFRIDRSVPKIAEDIGSGEVIKEILYKKENLLVYLDGEDAPVNKVWKDRSGNNNDAIMSGTYTHDASKKAYHFTNEEGQGKITKFEYKEGVTISACVEVLEYNPENRIFIGNGYYGAPESRPSLGVGTDQLYGIGGIDTEEATLVKYPIYEEEIYTVSLTIDKTGNGKLYLNGELVTSLTLKTSFPAIPSNDFRIRGYGSTTNTDYYNTSKIQSNIYNVLVYDGALSEQDVKEIYEIDKSRYQKEEEELNLSYNTDDLLVYLDGEDAPIDNVWKDRSGNNNDAVMSGVYTHNVENKSYDFTDEDGQGKITKFDYTQGITISSRIEMNSDSSTKYVSIGNGYAGSPNSRPTILFNTSLLFMIGGNNSGKQVGYTTLINRTYTITMTIDKYGNGKTYINGKLVFTASLGTSFPATPANDFRIRGYGSTTNTDYYGNNILPISIHNVLVYDRELTQDEVEYIYEVDKTKY